MTMHVPAELAAADGVRRCALGLGANLGAARTAVSDAVRTVLQDPRFEAVRVSSLYRTVPLGGPEQPDYLNAVVSFDSAASAWDLLTFAQALEHTHGRTREVRWGPRTLDVDVLSVGALRSRWTLLELPHPRAFERAFVLVPWVEIDPDDRPGGQAPVRDRLAALPAADREGIERVADERWWG